MLNKLQLRKAHEQACNGHIGFQTRQRGAQAKIDAMAKAEGARFATPQVKAIRVLTQEGSDWRKR